MKTISVDIGGRIGFDERCDLLATLFLILLYRCAKDSPSMFSGLGWRVLLVVVVVVVGRIIIFPGRNLVGSSRALRLLAFHISWCFH